MYYDRHGNEITQQEWARAYEQGNSEFQTKVGDLNVSTVWLGLNHNWINDKPVIFETMIFGIGDGYEYVWRYHTVEEAHAGHKSIVLELCLGVKPQDLEPWPLPRNWFLCNG